MYVSVRTLNIGVFLRRYSCLPQNHCEEVMVRYLPQPYSLIHSTLGHSFKVSDLRATVRSWENSYKQKTSTSPAPMILLHQERHDDPVIHKQVNNYKTWCLLWKEGAQGTVIHTCKWMKVSFSSVFFNSGAGDSRTECGDWALSLKPEITCVGEDLKTLKKQRKQLKTSEWGTASLGQQFEKFCFLVSNYIHLFVHVLVWVLSSVHACLRVHVCVRLCAHREVRGQPLGSGFFPPTMWVLIVEFKSSAWGHAPFPHLIGPDFCVLKQGFAVC